MSRDTLSGAGLLAAAEAAQAALDAGTPPASSSEARFVAAMIARTRELAKRDQAMAPDIATLEETVVGQFGAGRDLNAVVTTIRSGTLDANSALHQALRRLAVLRLRATKPEALSPEDRS